MSAEPRHDFHLLLSQEDREVIEALKDAYETPAGRPTTAALFRLALRRLARVRGMSGSL